MSEKRKFKVKMLSRNPDEYLRETKQDIHKLPRNYDPGLHPFEAAREYTQALNAVKLERVFAKPFLGSLDGHRDGISCLVKHPLSLSITLSGSYDGEIRAWNLAEKKCTRTIVAHDCCVRGICFNPDGERFFSCSDDKTIKTWSIEGARSSQEEEPINTILGKHVYHGISHHWKRNVFATCGEQVDIWDEERTEPTRTFTWGVDTVKSVRFNPVETHILGATAVDRSVMLYDMRGSAPLRKVILKMVSNAIAWNPMEAFTFTVANEDSNLYTFDMRRLDMPRNVHMDHVSSVLDVDYSPSGQELVSGSYDKSVRIFPLEKGRSRDIYHTKRMQRVHSVLWSADNKYILSGSDEMSIRLWKSKASEKLGVLRPRERVALEYSEKLKEKFADHPQVRRIARHRHVPRSIYSERKIQLIMRNSRKKRESNARAHSTPGKVPYVPERKKNIIKVVE